VQALLRQYRPDEVYVPYRLDPHADHVATHAVVSDALRTQGLSTVIWEYPVWFWNVWPWVRWPDRAWAGTSALKQVLRSNKRLFGDFTHAVDIRAVLDQKRAALGQYQSQLTRYRPNTDWPNLRDVSNGEFLDCFFQAQEIFRCRTAAEIV